jgi:hypothetical protein
VRSNSTWDSAAGYTWHSVDAHSHSSWPACEKQPAPCLPTISRRLLQRGVAVCSCNSINGSSAAATQRQCRRCQRNRAHSTKGRGWQRTAALMQLGERRGCGSSQVWCHKVMVCGRELVRRSARCCEQCRESTKTHNSTTNTATRGSSVRQRDLGAAGEMQRRSGGAGDCLQGADAAPDIPAWPQPAADMRPGRAPRQAHRDEWRVKEQRVKYVLIAAVANRGRDTQMEGRRREGRRHSRQARSQQSHWAVAPGSRRASLPVPVPTFFRLSACLGAGLTASPPLELCLCPRGRRHANRCWVFERHDARCPGRLVVGASLQHSCRVEGLVVVGGEGPERREVDGGHRDELSLPTLCMPQHNCA